MKAVENTISFEGNYWWSDAKNVTSILEKELKDIFSSTRIGSIQIRGTDFNDGKENHTIRIDVGNGKITVKKS